MTIYLLPNGTKTSALDVAVQITEIWAGLGESVVADTNCHQLLQEDARVRTLPPEEAWQACDIVVTIGGDGTILHAARRATQYQKPLLGVNIGRLGFLTAVESDELDVKLRLLAGGRYVVDHRSMLRLQCEGEEECFALNDIVFSKECPERTISLDIACDDILVSSFRGDGVIFATPTGSTAYSMSAGGPIVDARLAGIIVTHICPHVVQKPPMVFDAARTLKVVSTGAAEEPVYISCDGRRSYALPTREPAVICHSGKTVPLIQFSEAEQLKSIDTKLKGR